MQVLEKNIEGKVCGLVLEWLGIKGSKLKVLGDTGYPDRIFWLPGGKPFMIEFKRPGGVISKKQLLVHAKLRALGYDIEVHDNVKSAFEAVIKKVDSPCLSDQSRKIIDHAKRVCALLGPGPG